MFTSFVSRGQDETLEAFDDPVDCLSQASLRA